MRKTLVKFAFVASTAVAALIPTAASAAVFGVFGDSATAAAAAVNLRPGHSAVVLGALNTTTLSGIDVLWALNGSNSSNLAGVGSSDVSGFVTAGGVLLYHDRYVSGAASILPGGSGIAFTRNTGDTIDIENAVNPLVSGPGGTINNATLDGGTSSQHGYATLASLPAGATAILNNGNAGQIVDFHYGAGSGSVYYSSIPLDFYLDGETSTFGQNVRNIYTPNVIEQAATLVPGGAGAVPEPATWAMMIGGVGLVGGSLRRRRRTTPAFA